MWVPIYYVCILISYDIDINSEYPYVKKYVLESAHLLYSRETTSVLLGKQVFGGTNTGKPHLTVTVRLVQCTQDTTHVHVSLSFYATYIITHALITPEQQLFTP